VSNLFTSNGWTGSWSGNTATFNKSTFTPGLGNAVINAVTDPGGDMNGSVVISSTPTNAVTTALGQDSLDFTAYGARWLGAATLGTDGFVATGNSWTLAQDTETAQDTPTAAPAPLPTWVNNTTSIYMGDFNVHTGDKYITLTRAAASTTDPAQSTVYKVELWTVAGNAADAYLKELPSQDARDSSALIGYVDLGRDIEGTAALGADGILSHIDYIL
jgi:hypothetical protein